MKLLKKTSCLLLCAIIMLSSQVSAFAAYDGQSIETDYYPPVEQINSENNVAGILATTSFSFTDLGVNNFKSDYVTYEVSSTDKLGYTILWTPTSQGLKIALRDVQHESTYYCLEFSGGKASGTWKLSDYNIPAGSYQVGIINPYGSAGPITGTIQYEWK